MPIAADLFLTPVSGAEFEGLMMSLNHSREPNAGVHGQVAFVAARAVAAGEELTPGNAIARHAEPMACRSRANGCRRLLTGLDWR